MLSRALTTTVPGMSTWFEGEQIIRDFFSPQPRMTRFSVGPAHRFGRPRTGRDRSATTRR